MRAVVLAAALVLAGHLAFADETPRTVSDAAAKACRCRVCEPDVCCKTPTGFAPLDQKCASSCRQEEWAVAPGEGCGTKPACCR